MTDSPPREVTQLLIDWGSGDQAAFDKLVPLVYEELRRLAHHYMSREHVGHTLQTTALVNEAYLRLVDQKRVRWQNRAHFFAIAAQMMRRILVDYARKRRYAKRGGELLKVSLAEAAGLSEERGADMSGARRGAEEPGRNRSAAEPCGGVAILRRIDDRRDSGSSRALARHGEARVGDGQSVALPGDEQE